MAIPWSILPKRFEWKKEYPLAVLFVFIGAKAINIIGVSIFIRPLIMLVILSVFCHVLFWEIVHIKVFYLILGMYIVAASELFMANIVYILPPDVMERILNNFWLEILFSLIIKIVVIILGIVFVQYINKLKPKLPAGYWYVLDIMFLVFIEVIQLCVVIESSLAHVDDSLYLLKYIIILSYLAIMMGIVVIYFFGKICWVFEKQTEYKMNQLRNNELNKIMSYQRHASTEIQNMKHDIKKHIANVLYLLECQETDQARRYTTELIAKVNQVKPLVKSGNHIVDTILSKHSAFCANAGIDLKLSVDDVPQLKINAVDISAVIDNIFDNAIEAVLKKDVDKKWIELKYFIYKGALAIKMTNPYSGRLKVDMGQLMTNKKDFKEHGYGLQSVRTVIEKHNGTIKHYTNDGIFSVVIFLPLSSTPAEK